MTSQMNTYTETVYQYRILRHEELPEEHKAYYRSRGINPDHNWSLIWSFKTFEDAMKQLGKLQEKAPSFYTYKVVDAGQTETIEREIW